MPSCGIIYSATGERYIAEAVASATSSLRYNKFPHIIYCDVVPDRPVSGIDFVPFVSSGNGFLDKIDALARTPFAHTLYLDSDTHVLASIGELFDLLPRFDLAAAQAASYTRSDDPEPCEAFYDFNTGVIAYRASDAVRAFLADWRRLHTAWFRAPPFPLIGRDQPAFRRALWASPLSVYTLGPEYNYRTLFPGRLVGKAKIIHGRCGDYTRLAAHLNSKTGPRSFAAIPPGIDWH